MTQDRDIGSPQEFSPQDQEKRNAIITAFGQSLESGLELVEELELPESDKNLYYEDFIGGITSSRFVIRVTDKEYEADQPPLSSWVRPCGIEIPTFSRELSVSLLNHRRYDHSPADDIQDDDIAETEGEAESLGKLTRDEVDNLKSKAVREGPQALFHFRDSFLDESDNVPVVVSNTLFATHMAQGMADGKFSVENGNPGTQEFKAHLIEGLKLVRRFISSLDDENFSKLTQILKGFKQMADTTLEKYAEQFLLMRVGVIKSPGIMDNWSMERRKRQLGPKEAIEAGKSYLNCDFRDLPPNEGRNQQAQPPQLPWREFTTNMWNNDHQLFGRYELSEDQSNLRVDYKLDSTHFPSKYGFFDTIEITGNTQAGAGEHIILSQEVNRRMESLAGATMLSQPDRSLDSIYEELPDVVFPIVIAGDFDFRNPELRNKLQKLASDPNVKPDVGKVITDILKISAQGQLERISS